MPEFKKQKKGKCAPNGDFFGKLNDVDTRSTYRRAVLKAPVSPIVMVMAVKKISNDAKMCVGKDYMTFEIGLRKIEVNNIALTIRSTGLIKTDWARLTEGFIINDGD